MRRLLGRSLSLLSYIPKEMALRVGKPLPNSFYQRAFLANRSTANAVANTAYLQAMHKGTLSPIDFGCLTVQDAYYCYHAQGTLSALLGRINQEAQPDLYDIVKSKVRGYDEYNRTFVEDWHIRSTESVIPTEAMKRYTEHERRVAREEDPIYTLVAYLPCYHLWPWFARQLKMSPHYRPGVYEDWFDGVYQSERKSFGSAWLLGSFIEDWKETGNPFDEDLAHDIYRTSMNYEYRLFSEAQDPSSTTA